MRGKGLVTTGWFFETIGGFPKSGTRVHVIFVIIYGSHCKMVYTEVEIQLAIDNAASWASFASLLHEQRDSIIKFVSRNAVFG